MPQNKATKTQRKRNNEDTDLPENKRENDCRKFSCINSHPKCKWTEFTRKKKKRHELADWIKK